MVFRIALMFMMAVGVTGLGAIGWITMRPTQEAVAAPVVPKGPRVVLVAAQPLRAGVLLKPEDIVAKEMKSSDVPDAASADTQATRTALVGAMLKRAFGKDEPLLMADVMRPTEHGFLAAVMGQGMRAVTIGVDVISGTAGLISPGDRVDVLLSQTIDEPGLPVGQRFAAETVLTNARVIAIDQQIIQGDGTRGNDGQHGGHTVTLEATSDQAARLTVALRIGRLSLTVRSADSVGGVVPPQAGPVFASDVSRALSGHNVKRASGVLRVYPGAGEAREFKF